MKSPFQASLVGQSQRKADPELLAVNALAAIDHAIDPAVRGQRSDGGSVRIRRRYRCAGRNECGLGDLDAGDLEAGERAQGSAG